MSLTWRLILSYIVIILVSLTLAFFTLIAVARPVQGRLAQVRLAGQSRQAAARIKDLYRQGASIENILDRLGGTGRQSGIHLIFLDPQGAVLADSQAAWTGRQIPIPAGGGTTAIEYFHDPGQGTFMLAATPLDVQGNRVGYVAAVTPRLPAVTGVVAQLGWGFVAAGLVALLVSLLISVFIARSFALPLQRIARGAAIAATGDYDHRLQEQGPPEVKRVALSFNTMIDQVERSQRAMRDLISNVSHELKTPLTSIQGFSQAIMEGATQDETARRRAAGIIHHEAGRMARMVEDLLDLARLDSGQVVMHKTPLDLTQILTATVERLLPQAAQKEVRLIKQWQATPPVIGDGDRLAQVFTNLLDNAVRHTPPGGQVTVSSHVARNLPRPRRTPAGAVRPDASTLLSERGDFVEVTVADTGPGISPEELARIFERFYQVDKSRKRGRGTGLGLAIAREILEAHGGYIRVESPEGAGARFTAVLPLGEADILTAVSKRT